MGGDLTICCEKHVFAHSGQYRTVMATESLSAAEVAELEQYQFGQTNDSAYLDSLNRDPGLIFRPLSSGRFGLTRVVRGADDSAGRSTLAFVTLVFDEAAWVRSISHNVIEVLALGGPTWDEHTSRINVPKPKPFALGKGYSIGTADALTQRLEEAGRRNAVVFSYADVVSPSVLRHVLATSSDDTLRTFSFAYRSLSDALPVQLNVLDRRFTRSGRAKPGIWFEAGARDTSKRVPHRADTELPTSKKTSTPGARSEIISSPRGATIMNSIADTRGPSRLILAGTIAVLALLCVLVSLVYGQVRAIKSTSPAGLEEQIKKVGQDTQDIRTEVVNQVGQYTAQVKQSIEGVEESLQKRVNELSEKTDPMSEIGPMSKKIDDMFEKVVRMEDQLKSLETRVSQIQDTTRSISEEVRSKVQADAKAHQDAKAAQDALNKRVNDLSERLDKIRGDLKEFEKTVRRTFARTNVQMG